MSVAIGVSSRFYVKIIDFGVFFNYDCVVKKRGNVVNKLLNIKHRHTECVTGNGRF
jgi:hypothetical protein